MPKHLLLAAAAVLEARAQEIAEILLESSLDIDLREELEKELEDIQGELAFLETLAVR